MSLVTHTDFDLLTEIHSDHIEALVRGVSISPDIANRFLREIRQTLSGERLAHLLIEFELAHALTDSEVFEIMRTFSSVMPGVKVALLNRDPRHHPSLQFGVKISQELGEDYGYFTDADAARTWLNAN